MSGADFFDSNVLVYVFDRDDARKQRIAHELVSHALDQGSAVISWQVVQETLHVITRRIKPALSPQDASAVLSDLLQPLWKVQPNAALFQRALSLQQGTAIGFYDSLIVAAALAAGCKRLLSEDLQHGQKIAGLRIENPFRA